MKLTRLFYCLAGVLLLLTALAKLASSFLGESVLLAPEPVFLLPVQYMLVGVGVVELIAAAVCFLGKRVGLQAGLVAWLATNFVVYRLGLLWVGYHKPCGCLGNLTDVLHLSPQAADNLMKVVLAYLLIGSYATLFWLWRQQRSASRASASAGMADSA